MHGKDVRTYEGTTRVLYVDDAPKAEIEAKLAATLLEILPFRETTVVDENGRWHGTVHLLLRCECYSKTKEEVARTIASQIINEKDHAMWGIVLDFFTDLGAVKVGS